MFNIPLNQYCTMIDRSQQMVKQHCHKGVLKYKYDWIEVFNHKTGRTKYYFSDQSLITFNIYKQNCRKRK